MDFENIQMLIEIIIKINNIKKYVLKFNKVELYRILLSLIISCMELCLQMIGHVSSSMNKDQGIDIHINFIHILAKLQYYDFKLTKDGELLKINLEYYIDTEFSKILSEIIDEKNTNKQTIPDYIENIYKIYYEEDEDDRELINVTDLNISTVIIQEGLVNLIDDDYEKNISFDHTKYLSSVLRDYKNLNIKASIKLQLCNFLGLKIGKITDKNKLIITNMLNLFEVLNDLSNDYSIDILNNNILKNYIYDIVPYKISV
ncbi:hypothetical protein [Alphaentomopoxvirus acuprea]|uniref:Uncharacterized protein n=1 Tax=Alphaentomopoxvirus acuprea TaxID=62099 RepID=W6JJ00_9POXV|nr:hypothetical protein BA82_gp233 [Anomala cuprea entomopoxvirus]BAO49593.1 hypothetical protein [Anomala cuprea entomopoxvirus]